jgi:hypothetical protein
MFKDLLNFTPRQRAVLEKLVDSPVVDKVLEEHEGAALRERQQQVDELRELEAAAAKDLPAATKRRAAAEAALEQANVTLRAAREEDHAARHAVYLAERSKARSRIERALIASADSRLGEFRFIVDALSDRVRGSWRTWPVTVPGTFGEPRVTLGSNDVECNAAFEATRAAMRECEAMQLQVLSYAAVTSSLSSLAAALASALAPLKLNPPQLARNGEIGVPLEWSGRSEWVVDKINHRPTREGGDGAAHVVPMTRRA